MPHHTTGYLIFKTVKTNFDSSREMNDTVNNVIRSPIKHIKLAYRASIPNVFVQTFQKFSMPSKVCNVREMPSRNLVPLCFSPPLVCISALYQVFPLLLLLSAADAAWRAPSLHAAVLYPG